MTKSSSPKHGLFWGKRQLMLQSSGQRPLCYTLEKKTVRNKSSLSCNPSKSLSLHPKGMSTQAHGTIRHVGIVRKYKTRCDANALAKNCENRSAIRWRHAVMSLFFRLSLYVLRDEGICIGTWKKGWVIKFPFIHSKFPQNVTTVVLNSSLIADCDWYSIVMKLNSGSN